MLVHPRRDWLAAHMSVSVTVAWISQYLAWLRPCQWSIQVSDLFSCATARSEQVKPSQAKSISKFCDQEKKICTQDWTFTINNGKLLTPNFHNKIKKEKKVIYFPNEQIILQIALTFLQTMLDSTKSVCS
jgi:hypothetical protein